MNLCVVCPGACDDDLIAAGIFGGVEGEIGIREELHAVAGEFRDADATVAMNTSSVIRAAGLRNGLFIGSLTSGGAGRLGEGAGVASRVSSAVREGPLTSGRRIPTGIQAFERQIPLKLEGGCAWPESR